MSINAPAAVEDVLVDGHDATHLIRRDEPLVSTRQEVVSQLPPVNPIGIAIHTQCQELALNITMQSEVLAVGSFVGH